TLDEVQIGFAVLHAVLALRVLGRPQLKAITIGLDAIRLEHLGDDLRHAEVLVDLLVGSMGEIGQPRHQPQSVAGQTLAGLPLRDTNNLTVNTCAIGCEGEKGRLMQKTLQIDIVAFADDLQLEAIRLADRLAAAELEHLEVVLDAFDAQIEMAFIGRIEHGDLPCHARRPNQRPKRGDVGLARNAASNGSRLSLRLATSNTSPLLRTFQTGAGIPVGAVNARLMPCACLALNRR